MAFTYRMEKIKLGDVKGKIADTACISMGFCHFSNSNNYVSLMCINYFSLMMAMDDPVRRYSCENPVSSAPWQPNREVARISYNALSTPRLHHTLPPPLPPPLHSSISSSSTPHPPPLHRIPTHNIASRYPPSVDAFVKSERFY